MLEDYFSRNIYAKLSKKNADKTQKDSAGNNVFVFEKNSTELLLLFVYSIFLRCSIARYHGFNMRNWERKLKKVFNKFLDVDIEKTSQKIETYKNDFVYFPLIATYFLTPNIEDTTKNFVTILHSDKPYFVYLNDMTFQLFTKSKHVGKCKEFFYGITDMINQNEAVNTNGESFKIIELSELQHKRVITIAFESVANRQMEFFKKAFVEVHKKIFYTYPPQELLGFFIQILITQKMPDGERYSREGIAQAMFTSCKVYYQIP